MLFETDKLFKIIKKKNLRIDLLVLKQLFD